MYWAANVSAWYLPGCVGHDEPTLSAISPLPGTGGNASFREVLPSSSIARSQGDLYATFWFGGVVYDSDSLDLQAFLELQFYPSAPAYTGSGSGSQDCGSDGSFYPLWTAGSNAWFACAPVWGIVSGGEVNVAQAAPLNVYGGNDQIMVLHSGDTVYVNYTGTSPLRPWRLDITDLTSHQNGTILLVDASTPSVGLGPYYDTAGYGNGLVWGASGAGAISFAYEIGHALNASIPEGGSYGACYPGGTDCFSYWPGQWARTGQLQLSLPKMGPEGVGGFPTEVGFSSSQGGASWINSTCAAPSFSTATNCMYPYYIYRARNYSLTFDASNVTNTTYNFGNEYQFPGICPGNGCPMQLVRPPWTWLNLTVVPADASVSVNSLGTHHPLPGNSTGTYDGEYAEGWYWVNASAPGAFAYSRQIYLAAAHPRSLDVQLGYGVTFTQTGLPAGTPWSVSLNGTTLTSTGSAIAFAMPNGTFAYSIGDVSGWHQFVLPYRGNVTIAGGDVSEPPLAFVHVTYSVPFHESGIPSTVSWAVSLNSNSSGSIPGSTNHTTFEIGNGTFPYSWADVSGYHIAAGSYEGTVGVHGANASAISVTFSAVHYSVRFAEVGMPPSAGGGLNFSGTGLVPFGPGGSRTVSNLSNGTYAYTLSAASGYAVVSSSPSSPLTVRGSNVTVSVVFHAIYEVTFTESGLPTSSEWSVVLNATSSGPIPGSNASTSFWVGNGTFRYEWGPVPGYQIVAGAARGNVSVAGSAPVAIEVTFGVISYAVRFHETGMPTSAGGGLNFDARGLVPFGSGGTLEIANLMNGSYPFTVSPAPGFQIASVSPSSPVLVAGANVTVTVAFTETFFVTFRETGMPTSAGGGVDLDHLGLEPFAPGGTLVVGNLTNGTYPYSVVAGSGYTVVSLTPGSPLTIEGSSLSVRVAFAAVFKVTFSETGMPTAASGGGVSFAGTPVLPFTNGGLLEMRGLANGTYPFTVSPGAGYVVVSASPIGSVTVQGGDARVSVVFEAVYPITFHQSGIANGTSWTLEVSLSAPVPGGVKSAPTRWYANSTGPDATLPLANGTYAYSLTAAGYQTQTGSFSVAGQARPVVVTIPTNPTQPFLSGWVWLAIILGVVVIAVTVVAYSLARRGRRR